MSALTFGSLFSGIGGLDLGLERAGMTCVWQSEVDNYCNRVLAKHWPDVPNLGDVTTIDWSTVERPNLICGGYPCQPFSVAGSRRGTGDVRHLWPYFADAIRALRPEWALLENVPGHLSLGFGDVQADLADLGYDTEWECVSAASVGAPHLRWRVVVVAHAVSVGRDGDDRVPSSLEREVRDDARRDSGAVRPVERAAKVADADSRGCSIERQPCLFDREWPTLGNDADRRGGEDSGGHWEVEPSVGRVADGVPSRVDRLRALGNAVVPQMAEWVGRQIVAAA